jgi:hypothetical protein
MFEMFRGQNARQPVLPCGGLWQPVPPCAARLDPLYTKIWSSRSLDLEACMPRCWQDWNGLAWVSAGWEERIQGRPTQLTLQQVGGYFDILQLPLRFPLNRCLRDAVGHCALPIIHNCSCLWQGLFL